MMIRLVDGHHPEITDGKIALAGVGILQHEFHNDRIGKSEACQIPPALQGHCEGPPFASRGKWIGALTRIIKELLEISTVEYHIELQRQDRRIHRRVHLEFQGIVDILGGIVDQCRRHCAVVAAKGIPSPSALPGFGDLEIRTVDGGRIRTGGNIRAAIPATEGRHTEKEIPVVLIPGRCGQ